MRFISLHEMRMRFAERHSMVDCVGYHVHTTPQAATQKETEMRSTSFIFSIFCILRLVGAWSSWIQSNLTVGPTRPTRQLLTPIVSSFTTSILVLPCWISSQVQNPQFSLTFSMYPYRFRRLWRMSMSCIEASATTTISPL